MEYTEIIYLLNESQTEDEVGNILSSVTSKDKCYAKKQSVRTNEFYSAVESGITPTAEFAIKRLNYNNQTELEWNNEVYSIIRTIDPKNKFDIVLVCAKKIGTNE